MELSPRRQRILKLIVEEHVRSALPVGSDLVARHLDEPVSPATVRNDMAVLDGVGLTRQPHTSAGRVPSDQGYRYYVEHLMESSGPSDLEERRIRRRFRQGDFEFGEWALLASSVLADSVRTAAVVSLPASLDRPRRFEQVHYEGLTHILGQPEFATSAQLRPVVEVLERAQLLSRLLSEAADDGVRVIIGHEHRLEPLRATSVVLTGYGADPDSRGVLGVVGPTRLPYWRAVAMVRFMGELMNILVARTARS